MEAQALEVLVQRVLVLEAQALEVLILRALEGGEARGVGAGGASSGVVGAGGSGTRGASYEVDRAGGAGTIGTHSGGVRAGGTDADSDGAIDAGTGGASSEEAGAEGAATTEPSLPPHRYPTRFQALRQLECKDQERLEHERLELEEQQRDLRQQEDRVHNNFNDELNTPIPPEVYANLAHTLEGSNKWYLDSFCGQHMCSSENRFIINQRHF
ncbi:unnamed protein product [Closterium sp. NIES-54]